MPETKILFQNKLLTSFVDALADPAMIVDGDLRVLALNNPATALASTLRIGIGLAIGIRSPDILEPCRRVAAGGVAEQTIWNEPPPSGRLFDVRVAPLEDDSGRRVLIVMRDMSESHRVERMRADFIANASHELRTPLASLLGFVETLQGPAKDDPAARERFLAVMADQGRRMARLINDLLSLSRIEQSLHVRPQTRIDLVTIVRHVADTLRPVAEDSHVSLQLALPDRADVLGERDELVRVVENLIENAIKYSSGDGAGRPRVDVLLEESGADWRLEVRDNGPGIAAEHLPRLTERFYRVDTMASRAKGGTGLGLAIVKHIVARHRGRFLIESRPGEGSCFTILLERAGP